MYGNLTIPLGRAGKFGKLEVDTEKFSDVVNSHVYNYGLRQILNDAMADKKDENGNIVAIPVLVAMAEKRLATLYSGELRSRKSEIEPVDPIEAEAWRLARAYLNLVFKPLFSSVPKGTKDRVLFLVNEQRKKNAKTLFENVGELLDEFFESKSKKAKEIWAQAEKNLNEKVNLDELGL